MGQAELILDHLASAELHQHIFKGAKWICEDLKLDTDSQQQNFNIIEDVFRKRLKILTLSVSPKNLKRCINKSKSLFQKKIFKNSLSVCLPLLVII